MKFFQKCLKTKWKPASNALKLRQDGHKHVIQKVERIAHQLHQWPFSLSSLAIGLVLFTGSATAYEYPSATGNWSGATGAPGASTKNLASGLRVRITTTGQTALTNLANTTFMGTNITLSPTLPGATNALGVVTTVDSCQTSFSNSLSCSGLGTVTIDFLDAAGNVVPVKNPKVHLARVAGYAGPTGGPLMYFGASLTLTTAGLTIGTPTSGTLAVSGSTIQHGALTSSTTVDCTTTVSTSAGCGTVPFTGTTSTLAFNIGAIRSTVSPTWDNTGGGNQDAYYITVSVDEDFGDAPASYDPVAAASHVIGDLRLGSAVTAENTTFANPGTPGSATLVTPSPIANATASSDASDDGVTFPASISTLANATTTVPVTLSGASRAGQVCGWIDFNKNGTFDNATERACASFVANATSANLVFTTPSGVTAGNTFARVRASYDTTGVQNPTGPLNSGEVEDYQIALAPPVTVSGNVFDDGDGSKIKAASGENYTATNITAVLLDGSNKVISTAAVNGTGDYTLTNVPAGAYTVKIIQTPATALTTGVTIPGANDILPTNWVATGENNNGTPDATVDRTQSVTVASANITNINFGIEQLPTAVGGTATGQANPGGTTSVSVPTTLFTGSTDPEGTVASYKITAFPTNTTTLTINGTPYTSASFPAVGVTVPAAQLNTIQVDPIDGTLSVGISFKAIDNAGQASSNTATATLPFTAVYTITGNVFDDLDGSKVKAASGENYTAANITAVLLDGSNKVISTAAVNATGDYTLTNVPAGSYTVKIIQTPATALTTGVTIPAANDILPTNWVATGENNNGIPDATVDRTQTVTVASANIANINFGIEQLPDTTALTPASQTNPGGTATVQVPTLAGTDPEDGALGSGKSFKIVTLPTNGTLTYNNSPLTAGRVIASYDPTLLKLDPDDGAITVNFTYAAVDAAGQEDPTPATVTMPFTSSSHANLLLVKRITAINGVPLNVYKDDTDNTTLHAADDNNVNWPTPLNTNAAFGDTTISTFLRGAIDGGKVKPGDTIEYTIYFLNAGGSSARNLRVCDRIIDSQKILSGSTIQLQKNSTTPTVLTNVAGDDRATFYSSSVDPAITNCNFTGTPTIDNGAIVVDVTGATGSPTWTTLPGSTGAGTTDTYGLVRFTTKVNQ
jgi:GEVED domain